MTPLMLKMYFSVISNMNHLLMNIEHNLKSLVELESQIKERLKEFQNKRKSNQKNNNFFSLSQICLAATTTIVVAINTKESFFILV